MKTTFQRKAGLADDLLGFLEGRFSEDSVSWLTMDSDQRHAVRVIAMKLAQILSGDPSNRKAWHGIIDVASQVADRLEGNTPNATDSAAPATDDQPVGDAGEAWENIALTPFPPIEAAGPR